MIIENVESEHIYREKNKIFVIENLLVRDIDEYFKEYDESIEEMKKSEVISY